MKKLVALLLAGAMVLSGSVMVSADEAEEYDITYLTPSTESNFWTQVGTGMEQAKIDMEKELGIKINYKIAPRRPGDIDKCFANPEKAYTVLGWKAEYNIEDMCRDSNNWQQKNPNGYGD